MTVLELYESSIKPLPASQRLELATLILSGIPPNAVVDESDEWTDEDLRDFTRAGWAIIDKRLGEGEDA